MSFGGSDVLVKPHVVASVAGRSLTWRSLPHIEIAIYDLVAETSKDTATEVCPSFPFSNSEKF